MRTKTVMAAATAIAAGLTTAAHAAPPCTTSMVAGAWAATSFEQGQAPRQIALCILEFNPAGRLIEGSCFGATNTAPSFRAKDFAGSVSLSRSCVLAGRIRFAGNFIRVRAKLDPTGKILDFGGSPPVLYLRQW